MEPIPLIVPQAYRRLLAFGERIGESVHLPPTLRAGDAPVPVAIVGRLLEQMAVGSGCESLGLRAGSSMCFEDTPLGRDVGQALTVGAALAAAAEVSSRYCGGQRLWVTQSGGEVRVRRRFPDALRRGRRLANDFALQMLIDLVRRGAGPCWRPDELSLEGPAPGHAEALAALAARSTHFGAAADCLAFPESVLALRLRPTPRLVGSAPPPLPEIDFADSVRATIRCLLQAGELNLPSVAEAAGTSERALQRRLAASGHGFARLVDEARFEAASSLLRDPALRIIDVSVELGYADAANFTRAFRRWTGVSPLAFRRATRLEPVAAAG